MEKRKIMSVLNEMKIGGDPELFPISQANSVKVACSNYPIISKGKFTVSINRINGTVKVTKVG